jgi:MoaA/NifB/PqqE/SkfB family radical SAM enzyme
MLHLLGRCNLRCKHCYMDGSPSRREELPLDLVLDAISECKRLGITNLFLTGGETLLYRGLDAVLDAAASIPGLSITIASNGMLVKPSHTTRFADLGVQVNVSIDGTEEFHDRFRCHSGAFRATEKGVRLLVAAGVRVAIATTITRTNLKSLPETVRWASQVGAEIVFVLPLLQLGRATEIAEECLTDTEMDLMLLQLSDLGNAHRAGGLKCRLNGVATRRFHAAHPCGAYVCNGPSCHRGVTRELKKLIVREDGTVLPEITNISPRFALGHLGDASLTDLVARYLEVGYERFDALCRAAYGDVLPTWRSTIVPWDAIVAARSYTWVEGTVAMAAEFGCGA